MRTNTVYAEPYPQEVRAAIYCRLSKDDDLSGPSASIQNQRELLCRYCEEQGWRVAGIFQDDSAILGPSQKVLIKEAFI